MSKAFLVTVIVVLVAFGGFMTWLHHREIRAFDSRPKCEPTSMVFA